MDYEIDAELVERNKIFGITVRRAPINYVGEVQPAEPKKRTRSKDLSKMTPEEIKQRKRERALHWYYEKKKSDPTLLERRRQDAKKWHKTKPSE